MLAKSIKPVCSKIREKYQGIDKAILARQLGQTTDLPDVRNRLRDIGCEHKGQPTFLPLLGDSSFLAEFVGAYGLISDIAASKPRRSSVRNVT